MTSRNPLAGAVNLANLANRSAMGTSASPSNAAPRGISGAAENTGNPAGIISQLLKSAANAGGGIGAKGPHGPRGPEKPSIARANAAARRLNGNAPGAKELKGL
jgi:hypothetical protein